MGAFDKSILKEDLVIQKMLEMLNYGSKTNFILNVLSLVDISLWRNQRLKELIDMFKGYIEESYENNKLMLSYNPLLSIALTCELLKTISTSRKKFANECNKILAGLLNLGSIYISKIFDEKYYESLILDKDFKERTCLKIIT